MVSDRLPRLTPEIWGETLSGAPISIRRLNASKSVLIKRWQGIAPDIVQPPLNHHYITLHLGGPKRIRRRGEGREALNDIESGSYSFTPAGSAFQWRTEGAVDFVHVYLRTSQIDDVISDEFDREAKRVSLHDALGARDPLLEGLLSVLADELENEGGAGRLYWDGVMHTVICRLLLKHSSLASTAALASHGLAPSRVKRVVDYIEDHLAEDISASELAAVACVSLFHFSRGFHRATGHPPYAFLIKRRIERSKVLLDETSLSLVEVAKACGFGSHSRFSTTFKRGTGIGPGQYRSRH